jgi:hypothetical protein
VIRGVLAVCACATALVGCRLDVGVEMEVGADGTGTIAVQLDADRALVDEVPSIAEELATDDIVAAGWEIDGPTATPDGGLTMTITHPFTSDTDATNLLNSIGPPFNEMALVRNTDGDDTTTRLSGLLGLSDGFASFADDDLVAAVGSVPFADRLAAAGATPEESMSVVFRVALPGDVDETESNGTVLDDGRLEWDVVLDGTIVDVRAISTQSPGDDRWWARPLSMIALVLLVAWVAFMVVFIGYVAWARRQRSRRRPPTGQARPAR